MANGNVGMQGNGNNYAGYVGISVMADLGEFQVHATYTDTNSKFGKGPAIKLVAGDRIIEIDLLDGFPHYHLVSDPNEPNGIVKRAGKGSTPGRLLNF